MISDTILCDIGNSTFNYLDGDKNYRLTSKESSIIKDKKVYYISVNDDIDVSKYGNWINLEQYVSMPKEYKGLGVDRYVATLSIKNGIIIDAGSAITVDKVKNGVYSSEFIYLGVRSMQEAYKDISSRLDYEFNFDIDLQKVQYDTKNCISRGFLLPLYSAVISIREGLPIYLCGGNAKELKKVLKDGIVDEMLIFKGMRRVLDNLK